MNICSNSDQALITMSTLGKNGKFANQIFQYAFLRIYAQKNNLRVETPYWIGQTIFGHNDPPISQVLPGFPEISNNLKDAIIPNTNQVFKNIDLWGYFQYNTQYYAPHQDYFRSLFEPIPKIKEKVDQGLENLRKKGKTIVGIHLRRGDYGYQCFFIAPSQWYLEWLAKIWSTLDEPVLFIASDEIDKVKQDFSYYNPITVKDLGCELSEASFYPDFYLLSKCDILAISNSSFSFAASMLNEKGKTFMRPNLHLQTLIPYNPWSAEVILRDAKVEDYLHRDISELPINFFTIVLNGQPFIKYHIDIFKELQFQWHWHIIEGVADLKHDTSWSLQLGGKITDNLHNNGRSYDGTTEYLDEIAKLYPDNITIYRQPEGVFWDGKKAMVNAPLVNIDQECLLWQVDVDELWTLEQICTARKMFISYPEKTAAFYWCWYFVGEKLIISTRNCYAQNPQQDWLRTWRFKPGVFWAAHEPPILVETLPDGSNRNLGSANPFSHSETENNGLIFQHYAYSTVEQLQFKEQYYGYNNAVSQWHNLQLNTKFPTFLRDYFAWVQDETRVDIAESCGVIPIAQKEINSHSWQFLQPEEIEKQRENIQKPKPIILLDGVFFQLHKNGVARVWQSLLESWSNAELSQHIIVLDRDGTAPKISGIRYKSIPSFAPENIDADRQILQQVCDAIGADLFISSYYTIPLTTPSIFMAYDMIPEVLGADLSHPSLKAKHLAIQHASRYIAISENTARDLQKFYPQIPVDDITIAYCGVGNNFQPAKIEEINSFKLKYGINKPYFLLVVSAGGGYKNGILFFQAFSQLPTKQGFDIICTGVGSILEDEYRAYTSGVNVQMLQLSDEELIIAYSGAVALVYPSKYEGFGMPIAEALACGCPVITCPNASIPEVAGNAAIYVKNDDVEGLANALCEVQKPSLRNALITTGLEQSKKFSWTKMAEIISDTVINATLNLNFKEINYIIFPDWFQSEESLCLELQQVIKTLATHPDSEKINLLIYIGIIDTNEAAMFLSSIAMNLLMEEDIDISEGLAISPVGNLSAIQWKVLLNYIAGRIILEQEDQDTLVSVGIENIQSLKLIG